MTRVTLVQSNDEFDSLEAEWDPLLAASADDNPFRSFTWQRTWWRHYGQDQQLLIVTVRNDDGELIGLAPLYVESRHRWRQGRRVHLLASNEEVASEYLGLILRQGAQSVALPEIFQFLREDLASQWDLLDLCDISDKDSQAQQIAELAESCGHRVVHRHRGVNRLLDLPQSWEDFLKTIPSRRRTKMRQYCNRINKEISCNIRFADSPSEYETEWNTLVDLHAKHWNSLGQTGYFAREPYGSFHRDVSRRLWERGQLFLASLCNGDEPLASSYALLYKSTVYEYQRGMSPQAASLRPGFVLMYRMWEQAIARGCHTWEFLRGETLHKQQWGTRERNPVQLIIPARRAASLVHFYTKLGCDAAYQSLRKVGPLRKLRRRYLAWTAGHPVGAGAEANSQD